eukprot:TRINITY_DN2104_c0_g1_i2.p1 TRINITY_DN2104_c0_g1~~TRINITY_DN2104_c0_g1_i2.p1  ORF type:complete len:209 (-),score=19.84 TRINITY_DN2104_c0_g1_i2:45-671(-)
MSLQTDNEENDIITPQETTTQTTKKTTVTDDITLVQTGPIGTLFTYATSAAREWLGTKLETKEFRSVGSFCSRDRISCPRPTQIPKRLKSNFVYYQTNYLLIFFILAIYSALSSPMFLLAVAGIIVMWLYVFKWRKEPIKIAGRELPQNVKSLTLFVATLLICYFASVGSVILWLFAVSSLIVFVHAFIHTPEQEDDAFGFSITTQTV